MKKPSASSEDLCILYAEMQMSNTGQQQRLSDKTLSKA